MPRVSVIIPTFNLASYIGRALDSALAQTYRDFEVIVADDGSTDTTPEVMARYAGRVQYLFQPNRGVASARNLGLSKAAGEFIAYLDADDMWYPQKLERQVAFLDTYKEFGIVHSDTTVIDEADEVLHHRVHQEKHTPVPRGYCLMDLLQRCHVEPLTVMERRDCVERTGKFDERLKGVDDYCRWILAAMEGIAFGYIDEPLAMYRWRPDAFSVSQRRTYSEAFVTMFEILLYEKSLAARCGAEAAAIIRARLYGFQRRLAYFDRTEGRTEEARGRLLRLIRERPFQAELYADFLKACIPPLLAARLRTIRESGLRLGKESHDPSNAKGSGGKGWARGDG